jgi:CPA2 family monovalent cation:H+ antiporter-2
MDLTILKDVVIIFFLSTVVNLIFTKLKIPTIIGYMLTGIIAGPHLLGLITASHEIELMAEIGVILLMFTIGIEFSIQHLIKIRKVVFLGGFMQFALTSATTLLIVRILGVDWSTSLFIGFLTALSSTAIVLKVLQERSELTSNYGRTVLGILIFQDILLVPLILYTNLLGGESTNLYQEIFFLVLKALGMIAFIFVGSKWLIPALLTFVVNRKNQELFLMTIFLICMAVALLTSKLGMSLAFGAFIAGLMISNSEYSNSAFGNLVPFKNTFSSFFFVSIGMLLNLSFIADNLLLVFATLGIVIFIKTIIAGGTGFILGHTFRGTVMVGLALSQVGEFSFILAKIGQGANLLPEFYFQLFLSVAVLSMSLSPFLIAVAKPLSNLLLKLPIPKLWVDGLFPLKEFPLPDLNGHLVIIGKDIRSRKLALMAMKHSIQHIAIAFDPGEVRDRQKIGEHILYGDAINDPILLKAHVDEADIVVVSVGDIIASSAIVEKVRQISPNAKILARAKYIHDMDMLYKRGADHVVPEKFETAIELFNQILKKRLLPQRERREITDRIRDDYYGLFRNDLKLNRRWVIDELPDFEINAYKIEEEAFIVNKTLKDISLRQEMGVTLLAIRRKDKIIEHPNSTVTFQADDYIYLLGKHENLTNAERLTNKPTKSNKS